MDDCQQSSVLHSPRHSSRWERYKFSNQEDFSALLLAFCGLVAVVMVEPFACLATALVLSPLLPFRSAEADGGRPSPVLALASDCLAMKTIGRGLEDFMLGVEPISADTGAGLRADRKRVTTAKRATIRLFIALMATERHGVPFPFLNRPSEPGQLGG